MTFYRIGDYLLLNDFCTYHVVDVRDGAIYACPLLEGGIHGEEIEIEMEQVVRKLSPIEIQEAARIEV